MLSKHQKRRLFLLLLYFQQLSDLILQQHIGTLRPEHIDISHQITSTIDSSPASFVSLNSLREEHERHNTTACP